MGGAMLALVGASLVLSASAPASAPDFVLRMPQGEEFPGLSEEAGGINNPRGIAASPDTGHVYVSDLINARINEYTAWGQFVKAWGWDVAPEGAPGDTAGDELETCGPTVPDPDPPVGLCQKGSAGAGKGQLNWPRGLAVDPEGNVYVLEFFNRRVQKFGPSGEFLAMFGGDVNRTKSEEGAPPEQRNVCPTPIDPGDVCQAGIEGDEPSQLDTTLGDYIAYSPAGGGTILVGDKGGIQIFDLEGNYLGTIAFEGVLAALAGKQVNGLDVDRDRNVYVTLDGTEDIYKLNPDGEPLDPGKPASSSFKAENPLGVAVGVDGSVYAIDEPEGSGGAERHVVKFSASGEKLVPTAAEEKAEQQFPVRPLGAVLTVIATNFCAGGEEPGNLYVGVFDGISASYVDAYGEGPVGCEPPPPNPPSISDQFAAFVGSEEATLRALINPRFFQDVTYSLEYGTSPCTVGGCPSKAPVPPALLTDKAVNVLVPTAVVTLEDLAPGTTYHYRFVALGSGGGPVFGIDPDQGGPLAPDALNGLDGTFTTRAVKRTQAPCLNDAFRIGPGAQLPDCRAYEMVSPLEKGNTDVALGISRNNTRYRLFEVNQASPSAERFTFSATTAFGEAKSAPFSSQYLAQRGPGGWGTEGISPPRTESPLPTTLSFGPEIQGFSDDLCRAWLRLFSVAPLTPDAVKKYPNLYRRDNCAEPPAYTAITTVKPPKASSGAYNPLLIKGFSVDGDRTVFTAPDKLHPDAPVPKAEEELLYEQTSKGLRFVCYLPSGKATTEACTAGTMAVPGASDFSPLHNAISADGSRIFFSTYSNGAIGESKPGRIFVRIDGKETRTVSSAVSPEPAFFWTAAEDGSKAIFQFTSGPHKGELYEFDVETKDARLIADGVEGPMGASEEASRIYFASSEDLDGSAPAAAGDHNLYFYEADQGGGSESFDFIMALAGDDVGSMNPVTQGAAKRAVDLLPAFRAARVTPDGLHATLMSAASPTPTGYDNRDPETGKAAPEVYRYDAAVSELHCVSCNPTGARPAAGTIDEGIFAAARLQGWEALGHAPRVISDDGSRVFFESHEALVAEDANGTWDVYQWEELGKGTCTTEQPTFTDATGGCVDLISSGQSPSRSLFLDADPSGDNVFFGTQSSLVGPDYGLNDVYVARVGGGFPGPFRESECEGEACPNPSVAPPLGTPASEAFKGPGDRVKRPCRRGKRKVVRRGRARCVRKRPHGRKHRSGSRRGVGGR